MPGPDKNRAGLLAQYIGPDVDRFVSQFQFLARNDGSR